MSLKRFGVSLEDDLLESLDKYTEDGGFANRSQAIRHLVERSISETKWHCNHTVAGTVTLLYEQTRDDVAARIRDVQQKYSEVILSSSQYYLSSGNCLQVTVITGQACRLTELSDKLISVKGILHGKLTMSRAD
ncbi:MAG: nickel-responsive transcriptional regulator NikR [Bacteroidaceae bacterium]|nr:nickel-responsive transcriptional regulator NikR [Bacteroidaceae bacterium]